ncbi:MAG TPA: hypothetical protein DCZ00_03925, partial [Lactococcus sp.]|nr:hypothetical protein [Lactococcus sp.]
NVSWNDQEAELVSWYDALHADVRTMVQPVSDNFDTGAVRHGDLTWTGSTQAWLPSNLTDFPLVAADVTDVDTSGAPRAFALSLADVARLSGSGQAFPNPAGRIGANNSWWWLRTRALVGHSWVILHRGHGQDLSGALNGGHTSQGANTGGGSRPALIINQSN